MYKNISILLAYVAGVLYAELYEALISQENEMYKIINSEDLSSITAKIINSGASKFSELIEQ